MIQDNPIDTIAETEKAMSYSSTDTAIPGFESILMRPVTDESFSTLSGFWRTTVMQKKPTALFQEIIASLSHTLAVMAELDIERITQPARHPTCPQVSGLVDIYGPTERLVVLSFPEKSALGITQDIVGDYADATRAGLISDCIGELVHTTVGRALSQVNQEGCSYVFSQPVVLNGDRGDLLWGKDYDCIDSHFTCKFGNFHLQLLSHAHDIALSRRSE